MRPGWAPSMPRGDGVLPGGVKHPPGAYRISAVRPAPCSRIHRQGPISRDVIEGSLSFARPAFPLPVTPGWNRGSWASPRSFAPRRYQRRTSRWRRVIGHGPGTTLSSAPPPTPSPKGSPLTTRDPVSHTHLKGAPGLARTRPSTSHILAAQEHPFSCSTRPLGDPPMKAPG
jgi:hypothetical protein